MRNWTRTQLNWTSLVIQWKYVAMPWKWRTVNTKWWILPYLKYNWCIVCAVDHIIFCLWFVSVWVFCVFFFIYTWYLEIHLTVQLVPISIKDVCSNPVDGELCDTTLCDKVCQWPPTGSWFTPGTQVCHPSIKIDHHDKTEIFLKVVLSTNNKPIYVFVYIVIHYCSVTVNTYH